MQLLWSFSVFLLNILDIISIIQNSEQTCIFLLYKELSHWPVALGHLLPTDYPPHILSYPIYILYIIYLCLIYTLSVY